MGNTTQVRLSGFGGQGVVLAGVLLGEAGATDGKRVGGSNSYGAQARGSACRSEIVFSDAPIDFPHLGGADILVAMSQGAYDLYRGDVREPSGFILYDEGLVTVKPGLRLKQVGVPATASAVKILKNKQVANIILLGALVETTRIVSPEAVKKAIQKHVNERFRDLNFQAFDLGISLGGRAHG